MESINNDGFRFTVDALTTNINYRLSGITYIGMAKLKDCLMIQNSIPMPANMELTDD